MTFAYSAHRNRFYAAYFFMTIFDAVIQYIN